VTERLDRLAATWTALGRLVDSAPDDASLAGLRSEELLGEWPVVDGPRTAEGLDLWRRSADEDEDAATIREDHFLLFRGPGAAQAPPWASVYLSDEGLLFEAETFAVRHAYAAHGLAAPNLNREPDDHIALELEFCATLLTRALDAVEAGRSDEAATLEAAHDAFCRDHLLPFAPTFFGLVEQHASTDFYRGVGVLGADAMAHLADGLADG